MKSFCTFLALLFSVCIFPSGSFAQNTTYSIRGELASNHQAKTVLFLYGTETFSMEELPIQHGKFQLQGELDEPLFAQMVALHPDRRIVLAEFILDEFPVSISLNGQQNGMIKVSGSARNKVFNEYFEEDLQLRAIKSSLLVRSELEAELGNHTLENELNSQLQQYEREQNILLLKKYVANHRNDIVAAILPHYSPVMKELKLYDWQEIYEMLSPKVQNSNYGKQIIYKINSLSRMP